MESPDASILCLPDCLYGVRMCVCRQSPGGPGESGALLARVFIWLTVALIIAWAAAIYVVMPPSDKFGAFQSCVLCLVQAFGLHIEISFDYVLRLRRQREQERRAVKRAARANSNEAVAAA